MESVLQAPPVQPVRVLPDLDRPTASHWRLLQRIVFRFVCAYWILYNLPAAGHASLFGIIPWTERVWDAYDRMWRAIVPWVAIHVFHLSGPVTVYPAVNGSGDSTLDYVHNLCLVVLAAVATLVWSVLDRKRENYRRLHLWLRILVRYVLAITLFGYGFAKVFPLQFTFPRFDRMIEPFNQFSPMGLLWTFMGYSKAYTIFSGAAEVTGGLLLLFRRTVTLGAMVSAAVLLNVVMLNFCYDVPVKLYSLNLLLMAIFLMAPDLGRLANVLVFNRPVRSAKLAGPFERRWTRNSMAVVKTLFIGFVLFQEIKGGYEGYRSFYVTAPKPPLFGLYEVEGFTRNGQELPPLTTDTNRWKRVVSQFPTGLGVRMMDDSSRFFGAEYDQGGNAVALFVGGDKSKKYPFTYSRPDPDHVVLQGVLVNDSLLVKLRKVDTSTFLIVNRGFHWINERPFNR